jgi:hypothetical protein
VGPGVRNRGAWITRSPPHVHALRSGPPSLLTGNGLALCLLLSASTTWRPGRGSHECTAVLPRELRVWHALL